MRILALLLLCVPGGFVYAEPPVPRAEQFMRQFQHQLPQQAHPGWQLEWNNQAPQQRQALDSFYQSLQNLQQMQQLQQPAERMQREQRIEQLRDMSPQQRYEHFHDFVQDRAAPTPSFH